MLEALFASIVTLFFWGRATKEVEEKTQLASKTRTFVYFVLLIVVAIFYYKTYQVATIYNYVDIESWRETRDSSNNSVDTVTNVMIKNDFSSGGLYNREMKIVKDLQDSLSGRGGVFVRIGTHVGKSYNYVTRKGHEHELIYKAPFDNMGPVYQVTTITSVVPSFIPAFFTHEYEDKYREPKLNSFYIHSKWFDLKKHPDIANHGIQRFDSDKSKNDTIDYSPFSNAYASVTTFYNNADVLNANESLNTFYTSITAGSNVTNSIGFFTAADISQYVCNVQIHSNCHVRDLTMAYDLPIKISPYDSCMYVRSQHFGVTGKTLDDNLNLMVFHVELPTLANLQLIRSLILTTLLTALVSLFFSNLYYLIRRRALRFKAEHIAEINTEKLKQFKTLMYELFFSFVGLVLYLSYLLFIDDTIEISLDWVNFILISIATIICALVIYTIRQFKKIFIKKK